METFARLWMSLFIIAMTCVTGFAADSKYVRVHFILSDKSAEFGEIQIFAQSSAGDALIPLADGKKASYQISIPSDKFYSNQIFRLDMKSSTDWPILLDNVSVLVEIMVRRNDTQDIFVPIEIPSTIGSKYLERLDRMSGSKNIDRLVQSSIVFAMLRDTLGATDKYTRRLARMWYESAKYLSLNDRRFIVVNDDISGAMHETFEDEEAAIRYFENDIADIRSSILMDIDDYDRVSISERCNVAVLLYDELENIASRNPTFLTLRKIDLADIAKRKEKLESDCRSAPGQT